MAEAERMSIYRASRNIKRKDNSLYNALRSIYEDSIFVAEIAELWRELPVVANLRCGLWYSSCYHATCYFKSTDGHCNNWSFSTARLNLHIAQLAGQKGGCIIVDSTRKGKRFPDSMSKTIPIWACVLNRAIKNHLQKIGDNGQWREEVNLKCPSSLPLDGKQCPLSTENLENFHGIWTLSTGMQGHCGMSSPSLSGRNVMVDNLQLLSNSTSH